MKIPKTAEPIREIPPKPQSNLAKALFLLAALANSCSSSRISGRAVSLVLRLELFTIEGVKVTLPSKKVLGGRVSTHQFYVATQWTVAPSSQIFFL
jgi:hypothetical protein